MDPLKFHVNLSTHDEISFLEKLKDLSDTTEIQEEQITQIFEQHSDSLVESLLTDPEKSKATMRKIGANLRRNHLLKTFQPQIGYIQKIAGLIESQDIIGFEKISHFLASDDFTDARLADILQNFSKIKLPKNLAIIRTISHPSIKSHLIASIINRDKLAIKELGLTKEEFLLLGPHLTYLDCKNAFDQSWDENQIDAFLASCKHLETLKIKSDLVTKLPPLPFCKVLDCRDCKELTDLPDLPICADFNCNRCVKLTNLPLLDQCRNFSSMGCPNITVIPSMPLCSRPITSQNDMAPKSKNVKKLPAPVSFEIYKFLTLEESFAFFDELKSSKITSHELKEHSKALAAKINSSSEHEIKKFAQYAFKFYHSDQDNYLKLAALFIEHANIGQQELFFNTTIELRNDKVFDARVLKNLIEILSPEITELFIPRYLTIDEKKIPQCNLNKFTKLKALKIVEIFFTTYELYSLIPDLKALRYLHTPRIDEKVILILPQEMKYLASVFDDSSIKLVKRFADLNSLVFISPDYGSKYHLLDKCFAELKELKKLKKLEIGKQYEISDEASRMICSFDLNELKIEGNVNLSGSLPLRLQKLCLSPGYSSFIPHSWESWSKISFDMVDFSTCPYLQFLDLHNTTINDADLKVILSNLKNLRYLNLENCHNLTDKAIDELVSLTHLQYLNLANNEQLTSNGIRNLSALHNLEYLNIDSNYSDGSTFIPARTLSLETIALLANNLVRLRYFSARHSRIISDLVRVEGQVFPQLQKLRLDWCRLEKQDLIALIQRIPTLNDLSIKNSYFGLVNYEEVLIELSRIERLWVEQEK